MGCAAFSCGAMFADKMDDRKQKKRREGRSDGGK
jgi:hypothetical protein